MNGLEKLGNREVVLTSYYPREGQPHGEKVEKLGNREVVLTSYNPREVSLAAEEVWI